MKKLIGSLAVLMITAGSVVAGCRECSLTLDTKGIAKPKVLQGFSKATTRFQYNVGGETEFSAFVRELNGLNKTQEKFKSLPKSLVPTYLQGSPFIF